MTAPKLPEKNEGVRAFGFQIAILDNGFVYAGDCFTEDNFLLIANAKNIRQWGTTKGIGELKDGITSKTILDDAGQVIVPISRLVHMIKVNKKW
jgi:hypothetical protein